MTRLTRSPNKAPILLLALGGLAVVITLLVLSLANQKSAGPVLSAEARERLIRADSPALGPADAKVTIVEFFDPECEACRAIEPDLMRLLEQYKGQVRLVARYFPLHANSVPAAGLIEAAAQEGEAKRWQAREYLFAKQAEWGEQKTSQASKFLAYAESLGLDRERVQDSLDAPEVRDLVERDRQDGLALGVSGTPTFFVNGQQLQSLSVQALKAAIEQGLK